MQGRIEENVSRKTFALVVRGHPGDFMFLVEHAKAVGCYVVFTKTSSEKLVVQEVPW